MNDSGISHMEEAFKGLDKNQISCIEIQTVLQN